MAMVEVVLSVATSVAEISEAVEVAVSMATSAVAVFEAEMVVGSLMF